MISQHLDAYNNLIFFVEHISSDSILMTTKNHIGCFCFRSARMWSLWRRRRRRTWKRTQCLLVNGQNWRMAGTCSKATTHSTTTATGMRAGRAMCQPSGPGPPTLSSEYSYTSYVTMQVNPLLEHLVWDLCAQCISFLALPKPAVSISTLCGPRDGNAAGQPSSTCEGFLVKLR